MKNLHKLALISTLGFGFFTQANPVNAQQQRITCESIRGRYNFCDTDTRGGVTLVRQISNSQCRQGVSWGYDRNGIWVDKGCTAEFAVRNSWNNNNNNSNWNNNNNVNSGGSNAGEIIGGALVVGAIAALLANNSNNDNSSDDTVTCGSERGNFTRCRLDLRGRDRVVLRRQLSNSGCWQGSTWDYDRNGVWVDQGCRGLFEVIRR